MLRETDPPTPPPFIDEHNHVGNNTDSVGEEQKNRQMNTENHLPIKTEGLSTRSVMGYFITSILLCLLLMLCS
jgi:hypothetical protein